VTPMIKATAEHEENLVLEMNKASFVWEGMEHLTLTDISLKLRKGQVVAVVGDANSGRTLLAAIMGQIKRTSGEVKAYAEFGYVPQEPWLINGSIRDNIIFGLPYDETRYTEVVRVSGLTRDLMVLSNGDNTFISELNLSISQRHRVSFARCLYRDPEVILLEDPLSDFDQATAKRFFLECIKKYLANTRCIVLLTQHQQVT
jgi:ABC-type multidrug transport system fused ATPase/permease subunit